ncbi:hypothetical protein AJ79_05915 [Helicocarpus griseus UAMH5409]|uniref:Inositol polyphosphate-related phosphatase domain-containing protein n=1 Tax=Helicocarpus griseus UAMH5409 TaxID=1447875 RepID=A0A2B7XAQ1_9EURO|nr:hypothetical protein AJ79_05915 [Helicocarpus griseus UAMH5409]
MFLRTVLSWAAALASLSEAATTGSFSILTFNVAGLPAWLNPNDTPGDKETNAKKIGARLAEHGHDVVHLQEDFNYHTHIYETDNHPHRTATSGGVPFGSGLNTVANYPWTDFERIKWDDCSLNSGDCLTPKGFTFMRLQLDEGVSIDMYNLHADAGSDSRDIDARKSNFQQMADYIAENSVNNAVIVAGDMNFRYTTTDEGLRGFLDQTGLRDPWVDLVLNGVAPEEGIEATVCENPTTINTCETVDKVFYRGSTSIQLEATSWSYDSSRFLQANGDTLSDHIPVTTNFTWKLTSSY